MLINKIYENKNIFINFSFLSQKMFYSSKDFIKFSIIDKNKEIPLQALKGEKLLDVCKKNNINIIGACEGGCACATCHVILDKNLYEKIPPPSEKEEDKLDEAFELTPTSRLACQVLIDENFSGTKIKLPFRQKNVDLNILKNKKYKI